MLGIILKKQKKGKTIKVLMVVFTLVLIVGIVMLLS